MFVVLFDIFCLFLQPFPTIQLHVELFKHGFLFNLLQDNKAFLFIDNNIIIYNVIKKKNIYSFINLHRKMLIIQIKRHVLGTITNGGISMKKVHSVNELIEEMKLVTKSISIFILIILLRKNITF
jgi:hypothetical protein